jgi:hypothetical protein
MKKTKTVFSEKKALVQGTAAQLPWETRHINARRAEGARDPKRHRVGRSCSCKESIDAGNQGPRRQFKLIDLPER